MFLNVLTSDRACLCVDAVNAPAFARSGMQTVRSQKTNLVWIDCSLDELAVNAAVNQPWSVRIATYLHQDFAGFGRSAVG